MGPTRTAKTKNDRGEGSLSQPGPSKQKQKKNFQPKDNNGLPGVQKIKSQLRQARRLLAKEKLAADVRVATERRLKSLEAELAQAEAARKERNMAVKYHKVKFFERQKVVRKLNQTKKRLSSATSSSKSELESSLYELRVDLNYILHYPKTKKYISLFPPEIREHVSEEPVPKVNREAEEVRSWIREQMKSGAFSTEPELSLDARQPSQVKKSKSEWSEKKNQSKDPSVKAEKGGQKEEVVEAKDDFFEENGEEEEAEDSGSNDSD